MKRILTFGASNSKNSINSIFANYVASSIEEAEIDLIDLNDFEMPIYGIDIEKKSGIPEPTVRFKDHINTSDCIVISFAEHNPADNIGVYAEIVRRLGDRGRYSDTVDSILYESADSYAQARLIYLQNRRFELGESSEITEIDPFELDTEGF